ncbi:MAG: isoprenylcysteine carboxylmethyltransferase family protein [Chloroflexi bacterium]|nr:isoprenylcysteine carboxylmethyltransferase family protein [Chloroflexota bacterium]
MYPLIYTNPAASSVFIVACLVWILPEAAHMADQMAGVSRKAASIQDRGSLGVLLALQWLGIALNFLLAWVLPAAAIAWQRPAVLLVGVVVILLGVALRWYAIRVLGSLFTRDVAVSASQLVVQRGPYRLIRHPAYSGTLLTMLGLGLATSNWASLISLLIFTFAGHLYRVRVEEEALVQAIGQPYVDYMRRTKRFIPLLF